MTGPVDGYSLAETVFSFEKLDGMSVLADRFPIAIQDNLEYRSPLPFCRTENIINSSSLNDLLGKPAYTIPSILARSILDGSIKVPKYHWQGGPFQGEFFNLIAKTYFRKGRYTHSSLENPRRLTDFGTNPEFERLLPLGHLVNLDFAELLVQKKEWDGPSNTLGLTNRVIAYKPSIYSLVWKEKDLFLSGCSFQNKEGFGEVYFEYATPLEPTWFLQIDFTVPATPENIADVTNRINKVFNYKHSPCTTRGVLVESSKSADGHPGGMHYFGLDKLFNQYQIWRVLSEITRLNFPNDSSVKPVVDTDHLLPYFSSPARAQTGKAFFPVRKRMTNKIGPFYFCESTLRISPVDGYMPTIVGAIEPGLDAYVGEKYIDEWQPYKDIQPGPERAELLRHEWEKQIGRVCEETLLKISY